MPEQRGRQHRSGRVGEALKEEITALLEGELGDPRIGLCSVTEILLAPDGKSARVFIHVDGSEHDAEETLAGLNDAKGYIRYEIKQTLGVRHVPELTFILDRSDEYGGWVSEFFYLVKKRAR